MSDWNLERSIYKSKKSGQIDSTILKGGRKKKEKKVWKVFGPLLGSTEVNVYSAVSRELCEKWIDKQSRFVYCHKKAPSHLWAIAAKRAEERAKRFRIVGPKGAA